MKLGIALDGLLTDTDTQYEKWATHLGDGYIPDEAFWGALEPFSDVGPAFRLAVKHHELHVFVERPKAYSLVTRAWVRNHTGFILPAGRLVMQSIKRYDCRLIGIDAFIDSNPAAIENLKVETVEPTRGYLVDRSRGESLLRAIEELC